MPTRDLWVSFVLLLLLLLTYPLSAGELILSWMANTESDLAGYKIYYGTQPRVYTSTIDVGLSTSYEFSALEDSVRYYFAVTAYDYWSNESAPSWEVSAIPAIGEVLPTEITLYPNYPNPFVSRTLLHFDMPSAEPVEISIYNSLGRLVRLLKREYTWSGSNTPIIWDGKDVTGRDAPSGIYYCRISAAERTSNIIQIVRIK